MQGCCATAGARTLHALHALFWGRWMRSASSARVINGAGMRSSLVLLPVVWAVTRQPAATTTSAIDIAIAIAAASPSSTSSAHAVPQAGACHCAAAAATAAAAAAATTAPCGAVTAQERACAGIQAMHPGV
jgi:hypothetical protein